MHRLPGGVKEGEKTILIQSINTPCCLSHLQTRRTHVRTHAHMPLNGDKIHLKKVSLQQTRDSSPLRPNGGPRPRADTQKNILKSHFASFKKKKEKNQTKKPKTGEPL